MMQKRPSDPFWQGLEDVGSLQSTRAGWRALCGNLGAALIEKHLVGTGLPSSWYPDPDCPSRVLEVVKHPVRDGYLAFSTDEDHTRPDLDLSKADVAVQALPVGVVAALIAKPLGFASPARTKDITPCAIRLGPMQSHGIAVYLIVPSSESEFALAFAQIRQRDASPLGIITPTRRFLPAEFRHVEDSGGVQHAALCDLASVTASGIQVKTSLSEYFAPVKEAPGGPPYAKWPHERPARAQWGHVEIVFQDTDRLWIKFGDSQGTFRYTDIQGFASGSSGKPTAQYNLLLMLAMKNGAIRITAEKKLQSSLRQTRNRLKRLLCGFFGIKAKFHKDVGSKWECLFYIRWAGPDAKRDKLVCHAGDGKYDPESYLSNWDRMVSEAFVPTVNPDEKAEFTA